MCGIAGLLGAGSLDDMRERVARMVAAQHHRGPDDRHVVALPGGSPVVLGFARLAILDPSERGRQPMEHRETGSWLVANGEIYNFRALRQELEAEGHRFRSSGDAEVLLAALVAWGPAAMRRLRGMYAFAFFDGRRRELVLGRDPFGVKPLVWGRVAGQTLFASELRAIRAGTVRALGIDHEALHAYLRFGAVPEPRTMAREVAMLPPGHVLRLAPTGAVLAPPEPIVTLESFLAEPERRGVSLADAVAETQPVLRDAVEAHLVSDVPVGVLLSGGIDSTVVARLAAGSPAAPDLVFLTVDVDDQRFSEGTAARTTAARLGGRHEIVRVGADDVLSALPRVLDAMDQPTADGVNTWAITRAAATAGTRVLLSGIGGDELFGGYTTFRKAPLLAATASWLAPLARRLAAWGPGPAPQLRKVAAADHVRTLRDAYLLQRALPWTSGIDGAHHMGPHGLPPDTLVPLAPPAGISAYRHVSYLESTFYLRNQLLHDADVMSAAHSVELRVPFLDPAVLRAAWRLPPACHTGRRGDGKRVLRGLLTALDPAHPPAAGKRGFVLPWTAWMRGALGERVAATVCDRSRLQALGLPADLGRSMLGAFRRGGPEADWASPWALFTLLEWQERARLAP